MELHNICAQTRRALSHEISAKICSSSENFSATKSVIQNRLVFLNINQMLGGGLDDIFCGSFTRVDSSCSNTNIFCVEKLRFHSMPRLDNFIYFKSSAIFETAFDF